MSNIDQVITDLTAAVSALSTVSDSAVALISAIPSMIQAAVDEALAAGATPEQLAAFAQLKTGLEENVAELAAAVEANTPTPNPDPEPPPSE